MAYKRTKTGKNSHSTYNTKTSVATNSSSMGGKNSVRNTYTQKSNGVSYTTTTSNMNGYISTKRSNYFNPRTALKTPKIKNTTVRLRHASIKQPRIKNSKFGRSQRYGRINMKYAIHIIMGCFILLFLATIFK